MTSVIDRLPRGGRVLIIRLRSLGDCVLTSSTRRDGVPWRRGLATAALLLAGCATLTLQQEAAVADVRAFARRAGAVYGMPSLTVVVGTLPLPWAVVHYDGAALRVDADALGRADTTGIRRALLAREVSHALLRHDPRPPARAEPRAVWAERQMRQKLEATATAVDVLARVEGWTERTSYLAVVALVRWTAQSQAAGIVAEGPLSACDELRDLQRRFPQHREAPGATVAECAVTAGAG